MSDLFEGPLSISGFFSLSHWSCVGTVNIFVISFSDRNKLSVAAHSKAESVNISQGR